MQLIEPRLFTREPIPLFRIDGLSAQHTFRPPFSEFSLLQRASELVGIDLLSCGFRGINANKLSTVIRTGIDVNPTTSTIFVADLDKAWEYGEWPKVLLALDWSKLDHTYRQVPATTAPDELARVSVQFPTKRVSRDGTRLWFSRLSEKDERVTTEYEFTYARWIPGDPFEALRAVFAVGLSDDELCHAVDLSG